MIGPTDKELEQEVEAQGVARDSPYFEPRLREAKLRRCQDRRGVSKCKDCQFYDPCELVKAHLTDVRYVLPQLARDQTAAPPPPNPWLTML
jgi:hypothetical protein